MKRFTTILLSLSLFQITFAGAKITLHGIESKTFDVYSATVDDFMKARGYDDPILSHYIVTVNDSTIVIDFPEGEARHYLLKAENERKNYIDFYAENSDTLTVDVSLAGNGNYKVVAKGNEYADETERMIEASRPFRNKLDAMSRNDKDYEEAYNQWLGSFEKFAEENPNSIASIIALNYVHSPKRAIELAGKLDSRVKNSYMAPILNKTIERANNMIIREQNAEKIAEGKPAPNFTLPNEKGKLISLNQFKGKWVLLDFWGTWCPWCIKGIPQMKENYNKYKKKLQIISIACNEEDKATWQEGLTEHKMPWIHVFSDKDNTEFAERVETIYAIQGYPTKILLDPKGNIHTICVGEDPHFYDSFSSIIK